jgi:hypothetical protein
MHEYQSTSLARTAQTRDNIAMQETTPLKDDLRHSVTIEATFGSAYQRDVAARTLNDLITSWKTTVESHHQKHVVTITHDVGNETTRYASQ